MCNCNPINLLPPAGNTHVSKYLYLSISIFLSVDIYSLFPAQTSCQPCLGSGLLGNKRKIKHYFPAQQLGCVLCCRLPAPAPPPGSSVGSAGLAGLGWAGLGWAGLGQLGWAGLAGLGWAGLLGTTLHLHNTAIPGWKLREGRGKVCI